MTTPIPAAAELAAAAHRVAVIALGLLPLLLVTLCLLPAVAVLPFWSDGADRLSTVLTRLTAWTRVVLTAGNPPCAGQGPTGTRQGQRGTW